MSLIKTNPLISIRSDATVKEAASLMSDCSIGAIGVLDEHRRFAGIVTERDLTWFVAQGRDAHETRITEIVNDFPIVVEGPLEDRDALERMRRGRVRHLLVKTGDDVRIVSLRDYVDLLDPRSQDRSERTA